MLKPSELTILSEEQQNYFELLLHAQASRLINKIEVSHATKKSLTSAACIEDSILLVISESFS